MSLKSTTAQIATTAEHVMRPARYAGAGVKGTAVGLLDGMARFGRKGLWAGLGLGIFAGIATTSLGIVGMVAATGFIVGAVGGAAFGALNGAYHGVTREARRDKYADEVLERQSAREARAARAQNTPRHSYRDLHAARENINNYNFERQLQQERENDRDFATYWQDRVSSGHGNGNGRGY